ncbi:uncharacterized protein LOC125947834 [Dermacentor silvarum]|uniref:uncharacterized protein LOC125947834 n=1 Tax=Dermacentor silvarum TaxID=543639 RepID=UPI0021017724|nr:uncharacterized protein LOC125947834 [Dermacentor silvarum]
MNSCILRLLKFIVVTCAELRAVEHAPLLLEKVGFESLGIRPGSLAARFQARFPHSVVKRSTFSLLNRWGQKGIPFWMEVAIMVLAVEVASFVFDTIVDIFGVDATIIRL